MTAAEAAEIRASLLRDSNHLWDTGLSPNGVTHCQTCDCQFLRALDAVIALQAQVAEMASAADLLEEYAEFLEDGGCDNP